MLLRLGSNLIIADRLPGGAPGAAYGVSGWGMPSYGSQVPMAFGGAYKPRPVGARYFCGDCYGEEEPTAQGNIYNSTKKAYQLAVTEHYTEDHPDLKYPVDQGSLDKEAMEAKAKARKEAIDNQAEQLELLRELVAQGQLPVGGGGATDTSGLYLPVTRPRELPDFTEFDFPDVAVADTATEEIELDQLISIAARQGRRFLGVEIQNLGAELSIEWLTLANADLEITYRIELNTRTGAHNIDDPESLWRVEHFTIGSQEAAVSNVLGEWVDRQDPPPGGRVYVAPRLFWRFTNNMDRQVDAGDLFTRIATVAQPLTTNLLFELLEEFSGLFGLA